jgi:hypothetical protein
MRALEEYDGWKAGIPTTYEPNSREAAKLSGEMVE